MNTSKMDAGSLTPKALPHSIQRGMEVAKKSCVSEITFIHPTTITATVKNNAFRQQLSDVNRIK